MRNFGVIAEYNPFHNGHALHLERTRALGANGIVAVMSGDFVQRGECAIMPQRLRAMAALLNGTDLVLSLPLPGAVAGAQRFADWSVGILSALGCVETISFGSESGCMESLLACADSLGDDRLDSLITDYLKSGCTYAAARQKAVRTLADEKNARLLSNANDILGIEYILAARRQKSPLRFAAIPREGAAHDENSNGRYRSASQLRNALYASEDISGGVPKATLDIIVGGRREGKLPPDKNKYETALMSALRRQTPETLAQLPDISEGLEYRLYKAIRSASRLEELLMTAKSKRVTLARLRRIVLCAYLGVTETIAAMPPPYIRVLGMNETGKKILAEAGKTACLPIIGRPSQIKELSKEAQAFYALECAAADQYALLLPVPDECGREMTDGVIRC